MEDKATTIILTPYASQAILAFIVMFLLNRFYKNYKNKYFQYWSWSWMGLMVYMIGSLVSLACIIYLGPYHPLRTFASIVSAVAGFSHAMWLLIGSYELSQQKEFGRRGVITLSILIIPIAVGLVLSYLNDPDAAVQRLFLRVGIKSLVSGFSYIFSAILILKLRKSGIGVKFIIIAFSIFGLEQLNYFFTFLAPLVGANYFFDSPYFLGMLDFLLQAIMGIGMIISVLELERVRLKKVNSELDTFLYRASHDLRAPLTTILGLVNAIKSEKNQEKVDGFMNLIEKRIHQADKVIKDIITLRKGQKIGLNVKEINLRERVFSAFEMLSSPSTNKIKFLFESEEDFLITDQEKLDTALSNILSNAIKYHDMSQPEPIVSVTIKKIEKGVSIIIMDNGSGIGDKYLSKIFDMFYRANENSKGSGLGLYLAKDAIDQIEGKIEVTSEIGIGTSFQVNLKNLEM